MLMKKNNKKKPKKNPTQSAGTEEYIKYISAVE